MSASPSMPPLLVINAPGFTAWTTHFKRLFDLVAKAEGSLMTVLGTNRAYPSWRIGVQKLTRSRPILLRSTATLSYIHVRCSRPLENVS